ncbi:methyltransferase domain-containing protein [Pedobacter gandavensis]|uniref:Methyltransferase domain-containing protein n=1 Tax=Pedobacter gandavensis TaxID=2679963 RepID=A0ABR6EUG1_9SPHI|nr:methyltransferase domain-containing protein [Pedobacter gandavensis]MBB2148896.1 methyltransferase domain-containing protein [Pedobacter gandavensis]
MSWNPDLYNKFKQERYAPFYDLLGMLDKREKLKVIDLGCGTGELTHKIQQELPGSQVLGIDASKEMLRDAAVFENENLHFEHIDIKNKIQSGEKYDLIFSNAALQWLDQHEQLWPEMIALLHSGGQILIQIPSNHDHFTHKTLQEIAKESPFKEALNGWIRLTTVLNIEVYAQILFEQGCQEMTIYEKVYPHVLSDANAILEWTSGTAMLPYLERLPENLKSIFTNEYKSRLQERYPEKPVFYPFKRTLMSGRF